MFHRFCVAFKSSIIEYSQHHDYIPSTTTSIQFFFEKKCRQFTQDRITYPGDD
ncbi:hypothetical protein PP707_02625 [Acetobacter pasteurianus]|nr:hypothetical protein [Acetobacter pasteurianus]